MQIKYLLPPLPHNLVDLYNQYMRKRKQTYKKQAGQLSTVCKLLKVSVGTVVLALPDGFKRVYITGGILTLILCGVLQCYSWNLLIAVIEQRARVHEDAQHKKEEEERLEKEKQRLALEEKYNKPAVEIEMNEQGEQDQRVEQSQVEQNGQQNQEEQEEYVSEVFQEEEVDDTPGNYAKEEEDEPHNNPLMNRIKFEKMNMIGVMKVMQPDKRKFIWFIQFVTLILFFGQAVSLVIFFNQTLEAFKSDLNQEEKYKVTFAVVMIAIIMGFSFIKRMEDLRSLTNMGSYLVFIVMYFFMSICLFQIKTNVDSLNDVQVYYGINPIEIPFFFGVSLFSYDINGLLTEVREEMKEPQYFKNNLALSMVICCVIYCLIGSIGYLAYGQYTSTLLTVNMDETLSMIGIGVKYALLTLQLLYALSMILTVILQNVVSIRYMEEMPELLFSKSKIRLSIVTKILIRFFYISAFVFTATYFQNFTVVISLLGSITSVILGFIMPYYLYNLEFAKQRKRVRYLNLFVLSLGVTGGILGVISVFLNV